MSDRKGSAFAGVGVAIVTPFTDGKLDVAKLKTQIEFQIVSGTNFLVPVGTTGESPTLNWEEHNVLANNYPVSKSFIKSGFYIVKSFVSLHCWID